MADTRAHVVVTVPRDAFALSAMRVVVGWVASCNDLALDELDDINLALETLLKGDTAGTGELTLELWAQEGYVHTLLEGLDNGALQVNLTVGDVFEPSPEWPLDVRLFLGALVEDYKVLPRGPGMFGILMRKRIS